MEYISGFILKRVYTQGGGGGGGGGGLGGRGGGTLIILGVQIFYLFLVFSEK